MKFVTFNINSIRKRLHQLKVIIDKHQPDIIGLQETKVQDKDFPVKEIQAMGYEATFHGQKIHYGVATLSKVPMQLVSKNFPNEDAEAQRRSLLTQHSLGGQDIMVFNGYFPQGENRKHAIKFPAKRDFYKNLLALIQSKLLQNKPVILMGDFNVAPFKQDVGLDTAEDWINRGACSFLPEEREWYQKILNASYIDSWRIKNEEDAETFSWFDYRTRAFERTVKKGLRIDHILLSQGFKSVDAGMDYDIRAMVSPSDHVPVWCETVL